MEKKYLVSTGMYMESVMTDDLSRRFVVSGIEGIHVVIQQYCNDLGFIYKKDSVVMLDKTVKFLYTDSDDTEYEYVSIGTWSLIEVIEV